MPAVPGLDNVLEGVPEEGSESNMSLDSSSAKGLFAAFNIGGRNPNTRYWNPDRLAQTPPPSFARAGSSAMSEDISMDSPSVSSTSTSQPATSTAGPESNSYPLWASRASTPQPIAPISAVDGLKKSNKRRRDDDLDVNSIKRRAVSPGVSVQNSPVLSQSPAQRDGGLWGTAAKARSDSMSAAGGNAPGERSSSGGSGSVSMTPSLGPKRIGLQGITDTNDGFMKMSID